MDQQLQRLPLEMEGVARPESSKGVHSPQGSQASPSPAQAVPHPDEGQTPAQAEAQSGSIDVQDIEEKVLAALRTCFDPEIPVNIYELGLVYDVKVAPDGKVLIQMTLTSPACPAAASLPSEVQAKARAIAGVRDAQVELVWDPPWTPERMTEAAKLQLGFF